MLCLTFALSFVTWLQLGYASLAFAASTSGTTIPPATNIVDGSGNAWTMPSLSSPGNIIYKNGKGTTGDGHHVAVLYYNGTTYAENVGNSWFQWTGAKWTQIPIDPRAARTGTTIPPASYIVDGSGNVWTMPRLSSPGNIIYENGKGTTGDGSHVALRYYNGTMYAENTGNNWFQWTGSRWNFLKSLPPASNAIANWQMAGLLSVGGIPSRSTVCATVSPLGSGRDDTGQINSAISACPAGGVVKLAAGTFTLAEGNYIDIDNGITLRGAGPGATIVNMPKGAVLNSYACGQASCTYNPSIVVGPALWSISWTPTPLTADSVQGSMSVQVANVNGFRVGQWVLIDEASGAAWQTDPEGYGKVWAAPDWLSASSGPATGRVMWQKHNPAQGWDDFSASEYPYQSGTTGCYYSFCDRPTSELHLITAITPGSGTTGTITFDDPLTIGYRTSHQARLYYPSGDFTENAGVEDMTITGGDGGNVYFSFCAYCWAKNVESTLWLNGGFVATYAARVEINEIYTHQCAWPVPGGGGYSIDLQNATTEIYVVNSISVQCDKVITVRSGGAGSVIAYNYMDDQFIDGSEYWQEIGLNGSHATGSHHVLFEGNYVSNIDSDHTHGNAIYHTFFRNYATGNRARFTDYISHVVIDDENNLPGGNGPLRAAGVMGYTYWMSFVGNVLGIPGHTTSAQGWANSGSFVAGTPGIWLLGWSEQPPYNPDPNSTARTLRDGNYDYYDNALTWDPSDTDHSLPNSLYLSSKPSFFTAGRGYTWPWVNPTGAPQFYTLPAKARHDAGTPFTQP